MVDNLQVWQKIYFKYCCSFFRNNHNFQTLPVAKDSTENTSKVISDYSNLSIKEQAKLLRKQSPELKELFKDFKVGNVNYLAILVITVNDKIIWWKICNDKFICALFIFLEQI